MTIWLVILSIIQVGTGKFTKKSHDVFLRFAKDNYAFEIDKFQT